MQVDIEDELYHNLKLKYNQNIDKLEYPSFKNWVNRLLNGFIVKK